MRSEYVITSNDPKFNKGLMAALSGSDKITKQYGFKSIFKKVYYTDTEAIALIKRGCEKEAKGRLKQALRTRIPFAKEVGLKMFIRIKEDENGETDCSVPGN